MVDVDININKNHKNNKNSGCNMFAYCLNNPVNMLDHGGNKPGDLFDSIDEAARDAALYMIELGIFDNTWEYATSIYSVKTLQSG